MFPVHILLREDRRSFCSMQQNVYLLCNPACHLGSSLFSWSSHRWWNPSTLALIGTPVFSFSTCLCTHHFKVEWCSAKKITPPKWQWNRTLAHRGEIPVDSIIHRLNWGSSGAHLDHLKNNSYKFCVFSVTKEDQLHVKINLQVYVLFY